MANAKSFPLVRGRTMRVTKTDGCCGPDFGNDRSIVTEGFVSVALTANITDAEEITVVNANGKTCVRDTGSATFDGYGVEMTFCEVQPCLFSMITGQPLVLDSVGGIIGFKMNSKVTLDSSGFALEVWMGVPGVACAGEDAAGAFGYLLLPCLQGGIIGDFTIENAAITFSITGANTQDGNGWGQGPYVDTTLFTPLDEDDHLYVVFSTTSPPSETDGCVALIPAGLTVETTDLETPVTLPRGGCYGVGDVTINWGDGTANTVLTAPTATATHTYAAPGVFDIQISGGTCDPLTVAVTTTAALGGRPAGGEGFRAMSVEPETEETPPATKGK